MTSPYMVPNEPLKLFVFDYVRDVHIKITKPSKIQNEVWSCRMNNSIYNWIATKYLLVYKKNQSLLYFGNSSIEK